MDVIDITSPDLIYPIYFISIVKFNLRKAVGYSFDFFLLSFYYAVKITTKIFYANNALLDLNQFFL